MADKGGPRPGAGRKPKTEKHETAINRAEKQIKDRLPEIVVNQIKLALGGIELVEEKWQPAGLVIVGKGETTQPAFPDKNYEDLVLVERKISRTGPDRAAGQYLINRILGTPVQKVAPTDPTGKEEYGDLTDETRINRLAALFNAARARRDSQNAGDNSNPDLGSSTGASDDGGEE